MKTKQATSLLSIAALVVVAALVCGSTWAQQTPQLVIKVPARTSANNMVNKMTGPAVVNIARSKPNSSIAKPGDAGRFAHTHLQIAATATGRPEVYGPPFAGFGYESPQSLACVYKLRTGENADCNPNNTALDNVSVSKGSQYIAVVDAYDSLATIFNDIATYDAQFGNATLGPYQFYVAYGTPGTTGAPGCQGGVATLPPPAAGTGWDLEESLDVEMAHAMAPGATIILFEAQSNSIADLACAELQASEVVNILGGNNAAAEISNSWGSGEWSGETTWDAMFTPFTTTNNTSLDNVSVS